MFLYVLQLFSSIIAQILPYFVLNRYILVYNFNSLVIYITLYILFVFLVVAEITINTLIYNYVVWININIFTISKKFYIAVCVSYFIRLLPHLASLFYTLCVHHHRFISVVLCSCLLNNIGKQKSYKPKITLILNF